MKPNICREQNITNHKKRAQLKRIFYNITQLPFLKDYPPLGGVAFLKLEIQMGDSFWDQGNSVQWGVRASEIDFNPQESLRYAKIAQLWQQCPDWNIQSINSSHAWAAQSRKERKELFENRISGCASAPLKAHLVWGWWNAYCVKENHFTRYLQIL